MSLQEWKDLRRLIAWLCSIFWIFITLPFVWIEVMALVLLGLTIRSVEGGVAENQAAHAMV